MNGNRQIKHRSQVIDVFVNLSIHTCLGKCKHKHKTENNRDGWYVSDHFCATFFNWKHYQTTKQKDVVDVVDLIICSWLNMCVESHCIGIKSCLTHRHFNTHKFKHPADTSACAAILQNAFLLTKMKNVTEIDFQSACCWKAGLRWYPTASLCSVCVYSRLFFFFL